MPFNVSLQESTCYFPSFLLTAKEYREPATVWSHDVLMFFKTAWVLISITTLSNSGTWKRHSKVKWIRQNCLFSHTPNRHIQALNVETQSFARQSQSDHLDRVYCASGRELGVGLLSLLSPSQHPDCPDSSYKFRYDPGRIPPLAFPVGMARQFVFPPNSVMVVFPFKWFQPINNSIYPPKSSLPWLNTLATTIPGHFQKATAD